MVVASTLHSDGSNTRGKTFQFFFSIYLVALGLNCHMQDLQSFLWHARSRFLIRDGTWPSALGAKSQPLGKFPETQVYFLLCWVFVAEHWLSLVAVSRCYSSLQYKNFLLQWLLLQSIDSRHTDSVVVTCRPKNAWAPVVATHGLQLLHGMWNLPRPGTKPMSPTLASRFLSTVP